MAGRSDRSAGWLIAALIALACLSVFLIFHHLSYYRQVGPIDAPGWFTSPYIAHACGQIDGHNYTNSLEALEHTLEAGNAAAVEIDLRLTSDGRVVCCHSWTEIGREKEDEVTYEEFMSSRIEELYTPMDLEDAITILADAKAFLVVDARAYGRQLRQIYQILVDTCREMAPDYLTYVIPQVYQAVEYDWLEQIFSFSNYILTLYRIQPETIREHARIADQCLERGIETLTMMNSMASQDVVDVYTSRGLTVAVHTIDSEERFQELRSEGVSMIYTNTLFENSTGSGQ